MRRWSWRTLIFGSLLLGCSCAPFEFPEKFAEPVPAVDAGPAELDAGVFSTEFTSCPTIEAPPNLADGGAAVFSTFKLELKTSIGLVDVFSAMPVGCQLPASATALAGNGIAVMPQPVLDWSTSDAGVLTVDSTGRVTGVAEGVADLNVSAQGTVGTRQVWVGGDAVLAITPAADYRGFTEPLHATATAGKLIGAPTNSLVALFSMRTGVGFDAVERSVFMQALSVQFVEGQSAGVSLVYREFGERLPGRVRDFKATVLVQVESLTATRVRLAFTNVTLRGSNGSASFSGHLEFSNP